MRKLALYLSLLLTANAAAVDLTKIDRTIGKEPKYTSTPTYGLMVFGKQAEHRVWLVHDGVYLYVDRNGNGDLTEKDEQVLMTKSKSGNRDGYEFEVGQVKVGDKVHNNLHVEFRTIQDYESNPNVRQMPFFPALLKKDPKGLTVMIAGEYDLAGLKPLKGRTITMLTAGYDSNGFLRFGSQPKNAPLLWIDGPMTIDFYISKPNLLLERQQDVILAFGTNGLGHGTRLLCNYLDVVPEDVHPTIEVQWPAAVAGAKPIRELYELPKRC